MSAADDAAERAYYAWRAKHPSEVALLDDVPPDVPSRLWAEAWRAGSWDGIQRNTQLGLMLSQIVERLEELRRLFADVRVDEEARPF